MSFNCNDEWAQQVVVVVVLLEDVCSSVVVFVCFDFCSSRSTDNLYSFFLMIFFGSISVSSLVFFL